MPKAPAAQWKKTSFPTNGDQPRTGESNERTDLTRAACSVAACCSVSLVECAAGSWNREPFARPADTAVPVSKAGGFADLSRLSNERVGFGADRALAFLATCAEPRCKGGGVMTLLTFVTRLFVPCK